ncbi:uncharacterized protein LOC136091213 [Hydra vulgaris]|uniref:Uncharacterized protein LOC136091213 n=1 Tax=Hydra vulgaris TaxID=6087 RepID=A0ABM4DIQ4_HYDVU
MFFLQKKRLKKHIYLTIVYRCDQGVSSVISITESVLNQFRLDEQKIVNIFAKSDNANCLVESMNKLCKNKSFKLFRYDFNEPCCGKDQCDRESAPAKTILRSYVDAGNDIVTAKDVAKAVKYGYGIKNAMVSVAKTENVTLTGPKIPNISNYRSYEFQEDYMTLWRYYEIGEGVKVLYNNLSIEPSIELIVPFTSTEGNFQRKTLGKNKERNYGLNTLHFCQEKGCMDYFETIIELEGHMLIGQHKRFEEFSSLDKVKKIYTEKMKATSQVHSNCITASVKITPSPINNINFQKFKNLGWALPTRKTFPFSIK